MLKLQYFGCLIERAISLEKTLMLGKIEGKRRGWQRLRWLDSITNSLGMNLCKLWEIVELGLSQSPWTARKSNQSIPKEINPDYSLEGLTLKLKLQYFGHLM